MIFYLTVDQVLEIQDLELRASDPGAMDLGYIPGLAVRKPADAPTSIFKTIFFDRRKHHHDV